jgi:predicted dehydrogenase
VSKTLKVVMVGCGAMSRAWLEAAAQIEQLEVVGLVDIQEQAAIDRRAEFKLEQAQTGVDLEVMLKDLRPDAIFDCSIPEAHHANALLAFRYGVHVLGEKPLAHTISAAHQMVEAARAAGCVHAVIQNRRYDPNIRRVRRYLESTAIGTLTGINADFYIGAHFGGFRDAMDHVLLLDMAIHTFDAARFMAGADPLSVYCHEWNPKGSWYKHGANAMCIFEMTGGIIFNYRGSWCSEGFHTTWESDWRVIGTQGTLHWDGGDHPRANVVEETGAFFSKHRELELPALDPKDKIGGHAGLIRDFMDCLHSGSTPETVSSDNVKSLAMVFAAIESAQTGAKVAVEF